MTLPEKFPNFSGPNTGKYGPEKTSYLEIFYAVWFFILRGNKKQCSNEAKL